MPTVGRVGASITTAARYKQNASHRSCPTHEPHLKATSRAPEISKPGLATVAHICVQRMPQNAVKLYECLSLPPVIKPKSSLQYICRTGDDT
jgi:hypothetical protein